jgi:hypothetical protein
MPQKEAMATAAPRDEKRGAVPSDATAGRPVVRAQAVPRQRNRMLAFVLASVVALVFVTVVALVVLFHYAEIHHTLASP